MKRKLTVVVLCVGAVLTAIVFLRTGNNGTQNSGTGQTLVVTQDGKLTIVPQHRDGWSVTMTQTNVVTNAPTK